LSAFFDTSVLIAIFLEDHEFHQPSLDRFLKADRGRDHCAAHSLAEIYATMTRLPGRHRLTGDQVLLFLEDIRERLQSVALIGAEYHAAIREAAGAGIAGGTIYDALIARCALKANATTLYTWNIKHFSQFGPAIANLVKAP